MSTGVCGFLMGLKGEVQEVGGVNAFGFRLQAPDFRLRASDFRLQQVLFVPKP
jgi:hypothetical protein